VTLFLETMLNRLREYYSIVMLPSIQFLAARLVMFLWREMSVDASREEGLVCTWEWRESAATRCRRRRAERREILLMCDQLI
jgi:hypothetical protein